MGSMAATLDTLTAPGGSSAKLGLSVLSAIHTGVEVQLEKEPVPFHDCTLALRIPLARQVEAQQLCSRLLLPIG